MGAGGAGGGSITSIDVSLVWDPSKSNKREMKRSILESNYKSLVEDLLQLVLN